MKNIDDKFVLFTRILIICVYVLQINCNKFYQISCQLKFEKVIILLYIKLGDIPRKCV